MGSFEEFLNWQFWATCLFNNAIVEAAKRAVAAGSPETGDKGWWKAVLTLLNIVSGLVCALPDGFLMGRTFSERAIVGVGAGLISQFVYALFLNRVAGRFGGKPPGEDTGGIPKSERKTPPSMPSKGTPQGP